MKDFKPTHKMSHGDHPMFCGGGKVMKKAEGGTVRSRFNSAFAEARNRGDKTFDFEGKKYTTAMATPSKPMANRAKPETEVNEYRAGSNPSVEEGTARMPAGARPSMEERTSERGMPVKTKMEDLRSLVPSASENPPEFKKRTYGLPGMRMGKQGEPAIVVGSDEDESPKPVKSNYNYGVSMSDSDKALRAVAEKRRGGKVRKFDEGGLFSVVDPNMGDPRKYGSFYRPEFAEEQKNSRSSESKPNYSLSPSSLGKPVTVSSTKKTVSFGPSPSVDDDARGRNRSEFSNVEFSKGGKAKKSNWIAGAVKNKGALHRSLGVPEGEKIPASKIAKATHSSNPKLAKRARLAQTLKSFHKG